MKKIVLLIFILSSLFGATIQQPIKKYVANGAVTDLVYKDKKLYCATAASSVDIFDVDTKKMTQRIIVPKIKDFMGDIINAKIYSVDILGKQVLVLSQAEHGYRKIDISVDSKLTPIVDIDKKLFIAKAKFVDQDTIIYALLSNDIISYNIKTKKENWNIQASGSKFSNFVLSEDKKELVVCDESGDLHIFNTKDGKLIKTLDGQNLDNVFQVDYKNGIIATAGQDRRTVVYDTKFHSSYYKKANFLIYSVGLSPSGKIAGYASDEENHVTLFKTNTKSTIGVYGGNKMTLTNILFINEKEFFVASDDKTVNFYKIK
jgi:WD40 repeat protein